MSDRLDFAARSGFSSSAMTAAEDGHQTQDKSEIVPPAVVV